MLSKPNLFMMNKIKIHNVHRPIILFYTIAVGGFSPHFIVVGWIELDDPKTVHYLPPTDRV